VAHYQFRLPDIGEGVAEAEVVVWHVEVGDTVKEDQSLIDVMTDKATVDITSPVEGVVTALHGEVGAMVPVGSILVELAIAGEESDGTSASTPDTPPSDIAASRSDEPVAAPVPPAAVSMPQAVALPGEAPAAAPSTRRRALREGVDLRAIPSSHPTGRITSHDLDVYLSRERDVPSQLEPGSIARYAARTSVDAVRIIGLRRKIAAKMQETKRRIPHIAYIEEVDVTALEALRQDLNAHRAPEQPKLTVLPFLLRAMVRILPDFPHINARYDDEAGVLNQHGAVHVGIATQTPGGLMVPVVRNAEAMDIWELATEISRLSQAGRDGSARREELSGSTITVTSLGPLGGIATTPVINHPEVAIIGPNKIVERPVLEGGFVSVRKMMNLSSSFDHRIVDGYDAALFVQKLKRFIEHPALIFMD
jgi:2-oxoisovalerate dehydrogenase E2 component (dihydrolipoyl transacylase)